MNFQIGKGVAWCYRQFFCHWQLVDVLKLIWIFLFIELNFVSYRLKLCNECGKLQSCIWLRWLCCWLFLFIIMWSTGSFLSWIWTPEFLFSCELLGSLPIGFWVTCKIKCLKVYGCFLLGSVLRNFFVIV